MTVKFTCAEKGGYIHNDGDIQIVAYEGDVAHGERVRCTLDHPGQPHTKACAVAMLDTKEVLEPAVPAHKDEDTGEDVAEVPAVLGKSPREKALEWFTAMNAAPPKPEQVAMPKKTIKVKDDKGKLVNKQVDDGDLA